jgi:hypothetical protein
MAFHHLDRLDRTFEDEILLFAPLAKRLSPKEISTQVPYYTVIAITILIKSNRPYVLSAKQAVGGFVGDLMGLAGRGRAVGEGEGDLVGALAGSNKHQDQ